jgi:hypothetical protein
MEPVSVVGLFCEDIREEKSEQTTIVGVLPDNIKVPALPHILPKLAIYVRINFDPNFKPGKIKFKVIREDGSEQLLSEPAKSTVDQAIKDSKKSGAPLVGLITKAAISPLPISQAGRMLVVMQMGRKKYTCASLNIRT